MRYARLLVGYDAVVGVVAAMSAYLLRFPDGSLSWAYGYALATFAAPLLWVGAIALSGGYEARVLGLGSEEFQRIFRAFVGLTATIGFVSYALKADIARGYVVWALPLAMVLSFLGPLRVPQADPPWPFPRPVHLPGDRGRRRGVGGRPDRAAAPGALLRHAGRRRLPVQR